MVSKEEIQRQLNTLGDFKASFVSGELKYLHNVITENEKIRVATSGIVNGRHWLIVLTNNRLLMLFKGIITGVKQIDMPLSIIKRTSHKIGLLTGKISIEFEGRIIEMGQINKATALKISSILNELLYNK